MDPYHNAVKKVRRKKYFIIHILGFLGGSVLLFFLNYFFIYTREPWFIGPVAIWAIALVIHGWFAYSGVLSKEWENKQIEKELKKHHSTKPGIELNEEEDLKLVPLKKDPQKQNWEDSDFV